MDWQRYRQNPVFLVSSLLDLIPASNLTRQVNTLNLVLEIKAMLCVWPLCEGWGLFLHIFGYFECSRWNKDMQSTSQVKRVCLIGSLQASQLLLLCTHTSWICAFGDAVMWSGRSTYIFGGRNIDKDLLDLRFSDLSNCWKIWLHSTHTWMPDQTAKLESIRAQVPRCIKIRC